MKSPATHFILAVVACAVMIALYGVGYATVSNKSEEVANLQDQIDTANQAMSHITSAKAALAEIAGDEAKVQGYFVPESGVVSFINDLESRGLPLGVAIRVLSVSTGGTPTRPVLVLALTMKGTFDAVMRTVGAIEYAPYDISITTLSVAQDAKNSWNANINLTVGSTPKSVATSTKP